MRQWRRLPPDPYAEPSMGPCKRPCPRDLGPKASWGVRRKAFAATVRLLQRCYPPRVNLIIGMNAV